MVLYGLLAPIHFGQLGDGKKDRSKSKMIESGGVRSIAACGYHSLYIKEDGSLWGLGRQRSWATWSGDENERLTPSCSNFN